MQKTHSKGKEGFRYFWNIKTDLTEGEYISRSATAKGVRNTLTRLGHKVSSVKAVKA